MNFSQNSSSRKSTSNAKFQEVNGNSQEWFEEKSNLSTKEDEEFFLDRGLPHLDALYRYAGILSLSEVQRENLIEETFLLTHEDFEKDWSKAELKIRLFRRLYDLYTENHEQSTVPLKKLSEAETSLNHIQLEDIQLSKIKELDDNFFSNITPHALNSLLNALPERYLTCIELADVENFSYHEISSILNRSWGTVMSQLHRSRIYLKRELIKITNSENVPLN